MGCPPEEQAAMITVDRTLLNPRVRIAISDGRREESSTLAIETAPTVAAELRRMIMAGAGFDQLGHGCRRGADDAA